MYARSVLGLPGSPPQDLTSVLLFNYGLFACALIKEGRQQFLVCVLILRTDCLYSSLSAWYSFLFVRLTALISRLLVFPPAPAFFFLWGVKYLIKCC